MGGMGLLKKRANPKAQQHSEEAEALLEDWSEALQVMSGQMLAATGPPGG